MRFIFVFTLVAIAAFIAFVVFSYMEQMFLGIILAWIMIIWPIVFWLVSRVAGNYGREKEETKRIKQDIIDEAETEPTKEHIEEEIIGEEFVVPLKKDVNVDKAREELEKLKKASGLLDEEKKEGLLSEESYNELKKQNKEAVERLEEEIAKAGGEISEKKVYCKRGNHYIAVSICLPSKIKGYVICPEHNEEIRIE